MKSVRCGRTTAQPLHTSLKGAWRDGGCLLPSPGWALAGAGPVSFGGDVAVLVVVVREGTTLSAVCIERFRKYAGAKQRTYVDRGKQDRKKKIVVNVDKGDARKQRPKKKKKENHKHLQTRRMKTTDK